MANYKLYITTYIGHSVNDTIPSAVNKLNYIRIDINTGSMFISDGTNWLAVGGSSNLDALTDVDLTTNAPDNNDVLTFTTTGNKWVPAPPPGAGGGEANTVTNIGGGIELAKAKVGIDIPLRTFIEGSGIDLTQNTNDVTVAVAGIGDSNISTHTSTKISITAKGQLPSAIAYEDEANIFTSNQKIQNANANQLTLYRTTGSDVGIYFNEVNDTPAEVNYAAVLGSVVASTPGSESSQIKLQTKNAGTLATRFAVNHVGNVFIGSNQRLVLSESGLTSQKSFTFPDSAGQVATADSTTTFTNKTYSGGNMDGTFTLPSAATTGITLSKTAASGAEKFITISVSDASSTDELTIENLTGTAARFIPGFVFTHSSDNNIAGGFIGRCDSGQDSGTNPLFRIDGRQLSAVLSTRPIFGITTFGQADKFLFYKDRLDMVGSFFHMDEIAAPSTPPTGKVALWVDSTSGMLSQIDDAGVVTTFGSGGGVSLSGTNTWTGVNTFDLKTQLKSLASTPTDPATGYTEIYGKTKDVNNEGIFAKYKIGGAVTEVELGVADDVLSITELSDVTTTSPADKHVLIHNGTQFVNRLLLATDLPSSVPLLSSANVFTAIQKINVDNGQQMTFYRPVNTGGFGAGFYYNFNTSTSAEATYGFQYVGIEDNTNGSHRGDFYIQLAIAGSLGIRFRAFTSGDGGIIAGNNQRILISETGLSAQRTITFPNSDQTLLGRTDTATVTNKTIQGLKTNVNAKTATYTAALTDDYIPCAPAANMTINLPAASTATGKRFKIQKTDNSAFTVTIDGASSETINGALTYVLNAQYQVVELECDGAAWYTTGYSLERRGKSTASGNGSATTFNLPHGLGANPHSVVVSCRTHTIATYTTDATNIAVTLTSAPANATDNVIFDWSAVS